jgi:predicted GNAT family acetyltransferase
MSTLTLRRYEDADAFLADAGAWLAEREAEHNLILGLSGMLTREPTNEGDVQPYLALVTSASGPVAAALRTPPMNLLLSEVDDPVALELLADDLAAEALPGATGPPQAVDGFGLHWVERHGGRVKVLVEERIYRLARVRRPPPTAGDARLASLDDRNLLEAWLMAFHEEALPEEADRERVHRQIEAWDPRTGRQFWLLDVDGEPVCLVGAGNPTPTGIRIGPVYTPLQHRSNGYASALTAVVSQWHLDRGRRFCFLYTDLANATANRIYQAIGYEPVTDARMVRFVGGRST